MYVVAEYVATASYSFTVQRTRSTELPCGSRHKANQRAFRKNGGVELLVKHIQYKPEETLENFLSFEARSARTATSCGVTGVLLISCLRLCRARYSLLFLQCVD